MLKLYASFNAVVKNDRGEDVPAFEYNDQWKNKVHLMPTIVLSCVTTGFVAGLLLKLAPSPRKHSSQREDMYFHV